jgi:hypothetical protein
MTYAMLVDHSDVARRLRGTPQEWGVVSRRVSSRASAFRMVSSIERGVPQSYSPSKSFEAEFFYDAEQGGYVVLARAIRIRT